MTGKPPVNDVFGRPLEALRLSVTDRCNLRCTYCMPANVFGAAFRFLPRDEILSFEELTVVVSAFVDLGVHKVRLTGGEPLLRRDLHRLVAGIRSLDASLDISLTTNGLLLDRQLDSLQAAGLNRVNISLDALNPVVAADISGRKLDVERVWTAVCAAHERGLQVKVNMVVRRGINEGEILPMVERCKSLGVELRFIEFMDVGTSNEWKREEVVTGEDIRQRIADRWPLVPIDRQPVSDTARLYRYADSPAQVGFVNSITKPFCAGCNRARLSAEGKLHTCLFSNKGISIKSWIRDEHLDRPAISMRLAALWGKRSDRYSEERQESANSLSPRPEMWTMGG